MDYITMTRHQRVLKEVHFQALIEKIYSASTSPSEWPATLKSIATAYDATSADFHGWQREIRNIEFFVNYNLDDLLEDYQAHYIHINPRIDFFDHDPQRRKAFFDYLYMTEKEIRSNEFCAWLDREGDALYGVGLRVEDNGFHQAACGIHFSRRQGHPSKETIEQIARLTPHLSRAVKITRKLETARFENTAFEDAINYMKCGILLTDGNGYILHANKSAEAIISENDGLTTQKNRLTTSKKRYSSQLQKAINEALQIDKATLEDQRTTLTIPRASDGVPYELLIAPFSNHEGFLTANAAKALVLISYPESKSQISPTLLQQLYELTPAEARLCVSMADGVSFHDLPDRLGITESTFRSRIRNVCAKTGTKKQIELLALLVRHQRDWR